MLDLTIRRHQRCFAYFFARSWPTACLCSTQLAASWWRGCCGVGTVGSGGCVVAGGVVGAGVVGAGVVAGCVCTGTEERRAAGLFDCRRCRFLRSSHSSLVWRGLCARGGMEQVVVYQQQFVRRGEDLTRRTCGLWNEWDLTSSSTNMIVTGTNHVSI